MKLAIINNSRTGVEVHAAGCADVAKSAKRNHDDAWVLEVESLVELSEEYWGDVISDEVDPASPEGKAIARDYTSQFRVLPCAKALPFDVEAPADEKVVSAWAAAKLVDAAIAAGGTLAAKFEAAAPSKTGSRSVRLTRSESDALREVATTVENTATGQVARSARTLRARLADAWA